MTRWVLLALLLAACGDDEPAPPELPAPMSDALVPMSYEGGALEDRMTIGPDPRDAAITEPTPILDLPLVIARPSAPLSTSSLEVLVIDREGAPVAGTPVSTGGPPVFTSSFGLAHVSSVYGRDSTEVYAFGARHTLGYARVAIRPDATRAVVLMVEPTVARRVTDVGVESVVEGVVAEPDGDEPDLRVTLPGNAFELPWGSAAQGPAFVRVASMTEPGTAGAVPGGTEAVIDGERTQLTGAMAFEVRVTQGGSEVEMKGTATVEQRWPTPNAAIEPELLELYFFDAEQGAFVPRGTLDVTTDPSRAIATIDRLGSWLIARPAGDPSCGRLEARLAGAPLPFASALLVSQVGFSAARVELDEQGARCVTLPDAGPFYAYGYARAEGKPVRAEALVTPSALSAACDDACSSAVLEGETIELACVRGTLSAPPSSFAPQGTVTATAGDVVLSTSAVNGAEFCLDAPVGAELSIAYSPYTCGDGALELVAAASPGASCATDGCMDLGTITCCAERESCALSGDEDCDGLVDEGCRCDGVTACAIVNSLDGCCVGSACAERGPATGECVALEPFTPSLQCPSLTVPAPGGDGTMIAGGCCRAIGECGVIWDMRGCIAAADVPDVWPDATLASTPCTM